jgi:hypothetical protein
VPAPAKAGKHTIVVSGQTSGVSANAVFTVT